MQALPLGLWKTCFKRLYCSTGAVESRKPFKCLGSGCSSACFPGQVLALSATGLISVTWVHKPPASTCLPVLGFHGMSADWLEGAVSLCILNHSNGGQLAIFPYSFLYFPLKKGPLKRIGLFQGSCRKRWQVSLVADAGLFLFSSRL